MTIRVIYGAQPAFPPTDQAPGVQRIQIGSLWVDYTGTTPAQADVDAFFAPSAEQSRKDGIKTNARTTALVTALTTNDAPGLIAAVAARYPGLTGDGLKAVTDLALVAAYTYRNGN